MQKNRLEAFSDGVIAIIITIMVLNLPIPESDRLDALIKNKTLLTFLVSYFLSFIYIGIYWNNHHALGWIMRKVKNEQISSMFTLVL